MDFISIIKTIYILATIILIFLVMSSKKSEDIQVIKGGIKKKLSKLDKIILTLIAIIFISAILFIKLNK